MSTKPKKNSLGDRLKKAREEAQLSQKQLARKVQLSDKAISSYEVNRAEPSFDMLKKIGKAVHKPVQYFLNEEISVEHDLQTKLEKIEQELAEVKKLLMMR